jgi:hypothetical protein
LGEGVTSVIAPSPRLSPLTGERNLRKTGW